MTNINYPWFFDKRGRTAAADDDKHVRDLIEELLFTNPGERVNRPDFGSGVQQLVFAPNSPELAAALQFTMQGALQRWLGDLIQVQNLQITSVDSTLTIDIQYLRRSTGRTATVQISQTV
jgi:phage baseplate assembly protein W